MRWCNNIPDDNGYWKNLEAYIKEHSDAEISHGICPKCMKKTYPGLYEEIQRENPSILGEENKSD